MQRSTKVGSGDWANIFGQYTLWPACVMMRGRKGDREGERKQGTRVGGKAHANSPAARTRVYSCLAEVVRHSWVGWYEIMVLPSGARMVWMASRSWRRMQSPVEFIKPYE